MGQIKLPGGAVNLSRETADLLGGASGVDEGFQQMATRIAADIRSYPAKEAIQAGDVVDVVGGQVTANTMLSLGEMPIGSTVQLNVEGKPREFIVVHHGKPSSIYSNTFLGTTTLMMKEVFEKRAWHTTSVNSYAGSAIHAYLNSTFLGLLDASIQSKIVQVKVPYRPGSGYDKGINSGESGLAAKIWLASAYELGWTTADNGNYPQDGAKFDYFLSGNSAEATARRVASFDAAASAFWSRSPFCHSGFEETKSCTVLANGGGGFETCASIFGIRPVLVLSDTTQFFYSEKSQAIALTSASAGQSCEVIFNGVASAPWATEGQTITSPGVQGYAPQDGWLWVKPEWDAKPFVVGTYTGDGALSREIVLGFRPSAVILCDVSGVFGSYSTGDLYGGIAVGDAYAAYLGKEPDAALKITATGFIVAYSSSEERATNDPKPERNPYRFIAFR